MKIAGIIAEYNPFHQGHRYQLDVLKRQYRPDYVIVAMSGDFVQRGTCALLNKYARARMALLQGADLILELPTCFATSSAELFARGGVLLFAATGLTDYLCFGAESRDLNRLKELADLLIEEPDWYRNRFKDGLKQGLSFPAARAKALPEYEDLLEFPNNILALEYLKAMKEIAPGMEPVLIQRKGSGYHDMELTGPFVSASAIRGQLQASAGATGEKLPVSACTTDEKLPASEAFLRGGDTQCTSAVLPEALQNALPAESFRILEAYQKEAAFLWENDFSLLLHHALLRETAESLLRYEDMTEALANRILRQRENFLSWSQFCEACDSRDMTYARISRALTHLLLGIGKDDLDSYRRLSGTASGLPYLRILGFRGSAAPLLTELKKRAKAPVLTSLSSAEEVLSGPGLQMLARDLYASDLYRSVLTAKTGKLFPTEYRRKLLTV